MSRPDLPCSCRPDTSPGCYVIGCERHTTEAVEAGPSTTPRTEAVTVTYWRGGTKVHTPTLHDDGIVWSTETFIQCPHRHLTPEAADKCSKRLARLYGRRYDP